MKDSKNSTSLSNLSRSEKGSKEFAPFFKSVIVSTNEHELFAYQIRIKEDTPRFQFLPHGKEILHRLLLRACKTNSIEELVPQFEKAKTEKRRREEQMRLSINIKRASRGLKMKDSDFEIKQESNYGSEINEKFTEISKTSDEY